MEKIKEACRIVVAIQKEAFGNDAIETHISKIRETEDVFLFDFKKRTDKPLIGGGGLLMYKKDMSVIHYCLPSYPDNIFKIIEKATEVEIPKEYR